MVPCVFAPREVRVSWESPAIGDSVEKPELSVTGGGAYGEHGEEEGTGTSTSPSPGSGPVEKARAARYLLMNWDGFYAALVGAAPIESFPFLEVLGHIRVSPSMALGCFGPQLASPLPLAPSPPG